jgi:Resolvase, N terminal domain/Recombinase
MKAIQYLRFSSDKQEGGSTIQRQTSTNVPYIDRRNHSLELTIKDEGVSGGGDHIKRGNLGKFLNEADTGQYQGWVLIVEELDRLSRMGIHETNALIQRIWDAGLTIELSKSTRVIAKGRDMQTAMMNLFEAWNAEQRRLQMKNYALNGAAKNRTELIAWLALPEEQKQKTPCPVLGALLPAWLKKDSHGRPVEVTEVTEYDNHPRKVPAKTVVRIFELAAEGFGARTILEKLNGDANGLSPAWVNKVLKSEAVLGEFRSAKIDEPVFGYYPQIVDISLFRRARAAVDAKNGMDHNARVRACAGRNDYSNLFYKLAWDVTNPEAPFRMARQNPYFITQNRAGKGRVHQIRYDWFERAFRTFIRTNVDWYSVIAQGKPDELIAAEKEQNDLMSAVKKLNDQIASKTALFVEATGTQEKTLLNVIDALQTKLATAETNLNAVTAIVNNLKAKLANLESPERLFELLDDPDADNADIRRKLKAEISKVVSRINMAWHWRNEVLSFNVILVNGFESEYVEMNTKTGEVLARATMTA